MMKVAVVVVGNSRKREKAVEEQQAGEMFHKNPTKSEFSCATSAGQTGETLCQSTSLRSAQARATVPTQAVPTQAVSTQEVSLPMGLANFHAGGFHMRDGRNRGNICGEFGLKS
jgi:hypothetical protein